MKLFKRPVKLFQKRTPPVYTTKIIGEEKSDGWFTAELLKDGISYAKVKVNSISATLAKSK